MREAQSAVLGCGKLIPFLIFSKLYHIVSSLFLPQAQFSLLAMFNGCSTLHSCMTLASRQPCLD